MERVTAYRVWQAPFAEKKLAPLFQHGELAAARRVLDVGCGPGTNARHFAHADYLGVDNNPDYISWARRRYGERFQVADVRNGLTAIRGGFDFILVNSLLHHLDSPDVRRILSQLAGLLTEDGHVHILDLVMPDRPGLPRLLARWDRGDYPRPLGQWRDLFAEAFEPMLFEPYPLGALRLPFWSMVYFKGRRKR
jgi:SAM-dependent methyltransferase